MVHEINSVEEKLFNGKAKVVKIEEGKLEDFIPFDKIKNQTYKSNFEQRKNKGAIKVYFETYDGRQFSEVFTKSTRSNSKLYQYRIKYKQAPFVGQEVDFLVNKSGFLEVDLS